MANDAYEDYFAEQATYSPEAQQEIYGTTLSSAPVLSKSEFLQKQKEEKLSRLGGQSQYESMSDSYTVREDGSIDSNRNKIYNEYTGAEYSSLVDFAKAEQALGRDDQGLYFLSTGERYEGPASYFYGYGTKDDPNVFKAGSSRGDKDSSDARYLPSQGGWASGESGVDLFDKRYSYLFPEYITKVVEGLGQGRKEALDARVVPDVTDSENYGKYGSGATEYYTSQKAFFGDPESETYGTPFDRDTARDILYKAAAQYGDNPYYKGNYSDQDYLAARNALTVEAVERNLAKNADFLDRAGNAIDAAQRTLTKEVAVDFADWVGEGLNSITGGAIGWDVGTDEEKTDMVNKFVGFNPYMAEAEYEEAQKYATNIVDGVLRDDKDVEFEDVYNLVRLGITTPEMLGDSVGFIGSFFVPFLGWGGKISKASKAIRTTEKLLEAGKISKTAAKARVLTAKTLDKIGKYAQKNAGLMQVAAGNVNDQIDGYREEFGAAPSLPKVAQMMVTETLMLSLDRWTDLEILKTPSVFKGVKDAFSTLTKEGKARLVGKAVKNAAALTVDMGKEAGQEYLQEIGQQFNVKFNFDDKGTVLDAITEAGDVLLSRDMQIAGVTGAGLGAGGAVQFKMAGSFLPTAKATIGGISNVASKLRSTSAVPTTATLEEVEGTPATEDEVVVAKKAYADLLNRFTNNVKTGKVTTENLSTYLDDVDELNATKHIIESSSPEKKEAGEKAYNDALDLLEAFIKENHETLLDKRIRITRKGIQTSLAEKQKADKEASFTAAISQLAPQTQEAFQNLDRIMNDTGEERDVNIAAKSVIDGIKENSFASYIQEEGTSDAEIKALASALTGQDTTELSTEEAFNSVKQYLVDNKVGETSKPAAEGILGSAPEPAQENLEDLIEEGVYDDETRAIDAERVVQTLLGSGRSYDTDFLGKLDNFALTNKVTVERLGKIKKSYEAVEEEATVSPRGYMTRLSRLKGLVESTNPRLDVIEKERGEIVRMLGTIEKSVIALERGIAAAKAKAADINKSKVVPKKLSPVVTEYIKDNKKPLDINIRRDKNNSGRVYADVAEAEKRLKVKQGYVKDINAELRAISKRSNKLRPGSMQADVSFVVPSRTDKKSTVRTTDTKFFAGATRLLDKLGLSSTISKVLLGENTSKKWDPKGEYYKANSLLINQDDYTEDDVVLINAVGSRSVKGKNGKLIHVSELAFNQDAEIDTLTPAQQNLKAAIEAGASIVLDRDFYSQENKNARGALVSYLHRKGYVSLDGYKSTVLVKETPEITKALQDQKAAIAEETEIESNADEAKEKLVALSLAFKYGVDIDTGEALNSTAKTVLKEQIRRLASKVAETSFGNNLDKVTAFVERRVRQDVENAGTAILNNPEEAAPLDYPNNKGLEAGITQFIKDEQAKEEAVNTVLDEWNKITKVEQLTGAAKESELKTLLSRWFSTAPKEFIKKIFSKEKSFSLGKNEIYENIFKVTETGEIVTKVVRKKPTDEQIQDYVKRNGSDNKVRFDGKKHIYLGTRRVVQDATTLVDIKKTTVLNSIPFEDLPFIVKDAVEKFSKVLPKALTPVQEAELADQTDTRVGNKFLDGNFNLYNSPARGIIFNKEGKANKEVLAAMYLALGDLMKSDLRKLTRGYRSDADLALMFGIQEHEVTAEMRDFAREHGMFLKTAANSVGKVVAQQLGLAKRRDNDTSSEEYEALLADLGNSALELARQSGLITLTSEKSNKLASLFSNSTMVDSAAETYFVNVVDEETTDGKYTRYTPVKAVTAFTKGFDNIAKVLPEAVTSRKEPFLKPLTKDIVERAISKVRNDIFSRKVPENAKKTLKHLMKTEYRFDMGRVSEFLDAVDAVGSRVKENLGYIALDSDEFDTLLAKDKEIQEAKNRDIEKSIEELRLLKEKIESTGEADPSLFFEYFYASNDRYMLESNTVNPQTDKVHRFLVIPKAHQLAYEVSKNGNGGVLFSVDGEDQSYTVRMAIAQGLGQGVDKLSAQKVISFADAVLSMSAEQRKEAKEALLNTGEYELITADNVKHKLEAEHITHALQTFDFLDKAAAWNSFESSLSLEFDSLTSGFANKIQQMPILENMREHFARTGILTKDQQLFLQDHENFVGEGVAFSPSEGHAIADVLDAGSEIDFYDSYQNLGKTVIARLVTGEVQETELTSPVAKGAKSSGLGVFDAIKPMLPGSEFLVGEAAIADGVNITGALRNLFKPPFMIFNYSATIGRIVKNLGVEVAEGMARTIATADLTDPKKANVKKVAEDLLQTAKIHHPQKSKKDKPVLVKDAAELQSVLRTFKLNEIKVTPFKVQNTNERTKYPNNLGMLLSEVVTLTYGKVVKETFEKEFAPFIAVQDAMNDTYKVAFRIFDHKRQARLSELQQGKENNILTAEDHAQVLEELWDDFPWIVGPLTQSSSKEDVRKAVITVATTTTRSPSKIEMSRVNPQTLLGTGDKHKSRTVTPLVRYMEEAVSSGSVLPFHAIDGAEMSYLINGLADQMGIEGITAIHDAVIGPLNQSDLMGFLYQKGMNETNKGYSLADALEELVSRIENTTNNPDFTKIYKKVNAKALKAVDYKKEETFPTIAKRVVANMKTEISKIQRARREYWGPGGKMVDAWHGNLASTPGGQYQEGMTEPDLSYKDVFKDRYREINLAFEQKDSKLAENTLSDADVDQLMVLLKGTSINPKNFTVLYGTNAEQAKQLLELRLRKARKPENKQVIKSMLALLNGKSIAPKTPAVQTTTVTEEQQTLDNLIETTEVSCP